MLLCALLVTQPRRWLLYILAALPIRLFSEVARDIPTWFLIVTFLIDSAKGLMDRERRIEFLDDGWLASSGRTLQQELGDGWAAGVHPGYAQDGAFLGHVGAVVDITDRRRAEEATQALAHAQRLAVPGEVTGVVAHEIRQPLAAILLSAYTASTLLKRREPPLDEVIDIMSSINADRQRAEDTIRAISKVRDRQLAFV